MMGDIVERLWRWECVGNLKAPQWDDMCEAADEIERLRKEVERLSGNCKDCAHWSKSLKGTGVEGWGECDTCYEQIDHDCDFGDTSTQHDFGCVHFERRQTERISGRCVDCAHFDLTVDGGWPPDEIGLKDEVCSSRDPEFGCIHFERRKP